MNNNEELMTTRIPKFIEEGGIATDILNKFIDQIDNQSLSQRKNALIFTIKKNNNICKTLFNYNEEPEYHWFCIKQLADEYKIFTIKLAKDHRFLDVEYENAKLIFNDAKDDNNQYIYEILLRNWLQRPIVPENVKNWNKLVEKHNHSFEDNGASLKGKPIEVTGWNSEQIIRGLLSIGSELKSPQTLRKLSSRCFLSNSKFLDTRQNLLESLYPSLLHNLIIRPVILNCYMPEKFEEVLFIENQDTFIDRVSTRSQNQVLIYSAGFRATMKSVRAQEGIIFSVVESEYDHKVFELFKKWWFKQSDYEPKCYFWGDLDYSGLSILGQLKKQFSGLEAWKPGYESLLKQLQAGQGHTPEQSNKQRQKIPELTGCDYTDKVLLAEIRRVERFVDQEID